MPENEQIIYVSATNGEIIADVQLLCNINIACTAQTRYSGTQNITGDTFAGGNRLREIRNTTAGNTANIVTLNIQNGFNYANTVDFANNTTNFTNGNWPTFNQDRPALDVHWGIERVLDYWATVHQRNSINGLGLQATNYVHYNDPNSPAGWPNNAQWYGNGMAMRFGDGDGTTFNPVVSIDITSHELGHGINQFTANLTPGTAESGALNEGFSDIWGASVENWAAPNKQTWLIGEEIFATSTFNCIRNLQNPKSSTAAEGKHPDTYQGQFWDNNGEPHNNSTVLSHWFYLVSQGGSGINDNSNNYNVAAIGINNARRIAFRALSVYLVANSGYNDARTQTINAARDLFCDNSQEVKAVTDAWFAVGVGAAYTGTAPSLVGEGPICTTQAFTVQNPIAGSTTVWSTSNTNGLTINTGGTASRVNGFNGIVNINATQIGAGGCATVISKSVIVGTGISTPSVTYVETTVPNRPSRYNYTATLIPGAAYQWFVNNALQSGYTGNTFFTYIPCGITKSVKCRINNPCGTSAFSSAISITGECLLLASSTSTYPNPVSSLLIVGLPTDSSPTDIVLINSYQEKVYETKTEELTINIPVDRLPDGVYYLHIINKEGTIQKRVLISHK